ncbi:alpha/beta hydrolase [Frondihabitans australicus]|uniref:Pimeloyl-ACP methyl ester carboxylesterase n=1 Tax=Frondihabitans australicus TaxID=386892 RepID=A0A495IKM4_9MICO|nr:alpha/beta hydrolase [Frondihabitans australicus]RKR75675.1 pimeloyl-ACP methyl ester carboxylesterase [Frondihabitans australicus]
MSSTKPTIVLVHGAFADASGYVGVIDRLEADGYSVVARPNPLRSLASDADSLRTRVAAIDGPVVLVGHSYAGAVIGHAVEGLHNVIGLVYLAAFGLEVGESCLTAQAGYEPSLLATENAPTSYDAPGAPGGPDLYINEGRFREVFAGDSSAAAARQMYVTQRPLSAFAFTEAATTRGWDTRPTWYLVSTEDNSIPPQLQRDMAARMGAYTEEIHGSHTAFIAHPHRVARFIQHAADSFAGDHVTAN